MKLATAAMMRELDRKAIQEWRIPSVDLMERAAKGVTKAALEVMGRKLRRKAAIFCGSGNNGGDGLAIARHLFNMGVKVNIFLTSSNSFNLDAAVNYDILYFFAKQGFAASESTMTGFCDVF